jgi:phosphoenolpyruvate carboxylase
MQLLELCSQRAKIAWKHAEGRNQKQMKLWLTRSDPTKVGVLSVLPG